MHSDGSCIELVDKWTVEMWLQW